MSIPTEPFCCCLVMPVALIMKQRNFNAKYATVIASVNLGNSSYIYSRCIFFAAATRTWVSRVTGRYTYRRATDAIYNGKCQDARVEDTIDITKDRHSE